MCKHIPQRVISLLPEVSWCAKDIHKQHLFQKYDFPFNPFLDEFFRAHFEVGSGWGRGGVKLHSLL